MPIFFQQDIDVHTKLAIWKIEEEEVFFLDHVPLQRSITHPHKRLQHLAGRYLLKFLYPDFPVDLIRVADTRKPFLENEAFHFSISHCGDYAAVIVSRKERVGIDIEIPSLKVEKISHKFLNGEELRMMEWSRDVDQEATSNERLKHLTLLWSCKEAVFKWWSYGNVDFSEKIKLQAFHMEPSGIVDAVFIGDTKFELKLNYILFKEICLAWVKT